MPLALLLTPLLGALTLIAAGAIVEAAGGAVPVLAFVAAPPIALLLGVLGTMLVARRVLGRDGIEAPLAEGFRESGLILVLTGVGGSLAEAISRSGLGDVLGGLFSADTALPLATVWLTAAVLHVAVGSVTISAITAAGVLAPVAPAIGLDPVLIALAAGTGALFAVHVTQQHVLAAAVPARPVGARRAQDRVVRGVRRLGRRARDDARAQHRAVAQSASPRPAAPSPASTEATTLNTAELHAPCSARRTVS